MMGYRKQGHGPYFDRKGLIKGYRMLMKMGLRDRRVLDHHPKQGHGPYFEGGKRRIFDPKGLQDVDEDGVDGPTPQWGSMPLRG